MEFTSLHRCVVNCPSLSLLCCSILTDSSQYRLFLLERQVLEFDSLGATRRMDEDGFLPVSMSMMIATNGEQHHETCRVFSRCNVVLVNFVLIRILIPNIVARPWLVGIGPANLSKRARANLRSMATLLYLVCGQLSPLPLLQKPPRAARKGRRASTSKPTPDEQTGALTEDAPQISTEISPDDSDAATYMSVEAVIGELAVRFPVSDPQVAAFVLEQQVRVR